MYVLDTWESGLLKEGKETSGVEWSGVVLSSRKPGLVVVWSSRIRLARIVGLAVPYELSWWNYGFYDAMHPCRARMFLRGSWI